MSYVGTNRSRVGIGSQTKSQLLKRRLEQNGIDSTVVKTDGSFKGGGCTYGLDLKKSDLQRALDLLREIGVRPETVYDIS